MDAATLKAVATGTTATAVKTEFRIFMDAATVKVAKLSDFVHR